MAIINQVFKTIMGITGEKPSLDTMLAIFDRELENFQTLVTPDPYLNRAHRSTALTWLLNRCICHTCLCVRSCLFYR